MFNNPGVLGLLLGVYRSYAPGFALRPAPVDQACCVSTTVKPDKSDNRPWSWPRGPGQVVTRVCNIVYQWTWEWTQALRPRIIIWIIIITVPGIPAGKPLFCVRYSD